MKITVEFTVTDANKEDLGIEGLREDLITVVAEFFSENEVYIERFLIE